MNKTQYLDSPDVRSFIDWFAKAIVNKNIVHSYIHLKQGREYTFNGLESAFTNYHWPFSTFTDSTDKSHVCDTGSYEENSNALESIKFDLEKSITTDFNAYKRAAISLMKWGGTGRTKVTKNGPSGNIPWLEKLENKDVVIKTLEFFKSQNDDTQEIRKINNFRFNSGLTKLYSLLLDNFIIYDSRVAATLAWYTLEFSKTNQLASVPESLRFACMRDEKHIRNPSLSEFGYTLHTQPEIHAHWNIRANWIIEAVLSKSQDSIFSKQATPQRSLEAALFMWGYDLTGLAGVSSLLKNKQVKNKLDKSSIKIPKNTSYDKNCRPLSGQGQIIKYSGNINTQEYEIEYCNIKFCLDKRFFKKLNEKFGKLSTVKLGASHTAPPKDSLGYWLKENGFDYGKTTPIAAVLHIEGYVKISKLGRAIFLNFSELSHQIG